MELSENPVAMKIVEPDLEHPNAQHYGDDSEDFHGRQPVLYHEPSNTVYLGGPNWYHDEAYEHHGIPHGSLQEGFIGGGSQWSNGKLSWYGNEPHYHAQINEALEKAIPGITTPDPDYQPPKDDEGDWTDDD